MLGGRLELSKLVSGFIEPLQQGFERFDAIGFARLLATKLVSISLGL